MDIVIKDRKKCSDILYRLLSVRSRNTFQKSARKCISVFQISPKDICSVIASRKKSSTPNPTIARGKAAIRKQQRLLVQVLQKSVKILPLGELPFRDVDHDDNHGEPGDDA